MQRVSAAGPDWVWSRLEVSGERTLLYEFVNAAAGPGFLDWEVDWYSVFDETFGRSLLGGAPSIGAARLVGHAVTDRNWRLFGDARRAAELDPTRCPFDLSVLIPVPEDVLRGGYRGRGEAWLWKNWGIGAPLRQVKLEIVQRPFQDAVPPLAVIYRFLSEDWAPALAVGKVREAWPGLRFDLACRFAEDVPATEAAAAGSSVTRDGANAERASDRRALAGETGQQMRRRARGRLGRHDRHAGAREPAAVVQQRRSGQAETGMP